MNSYLDNYIQEKILCQCQLANLTVRIEGNGTIKTFKEKYAVNISTMLQSKAYSLYEIALTSAVSYGNINIEKVILMNMKQIGFFDATIIQDNNSAAAIILLNKLKRLNELQQQQKEQLDDTTSLYNNPIALVHDEFQIISNDDDMLSDDDDVLSDDDDDDDEILLKAAKRIDETEQNTQVIKKSSTKFIDLFTKKNIKKKKKKKVIMTDMSDDDDDDDQITNKKKKELIDVNIIDDINDENIYQFDDNDHILMKISLVLHFLPKNKVQKVFKLHQYDDSADEYLLHNTADNNQQQQLVYDRLGQVFRSSYKLLEKKKKKKPIISLMIIMYIVSI